jgi:hypothetical protein
MASLPILWCLGYPHTSSSAVIWLRKMRDPVNSSSARWPSWRPFLVYTCQYVTPRDEDSIDYYCRRPRYELNLPGLGEMLRDTAEAAFIHDKVVPEAQHARKAGGKRRTSELTRAQYLLLRRRAQARMVCDEIANALLAERERIV